MGNDSTYDIAIIGSGLGGLACGSILSQRGYKVCVLEKHFQIGGCLQDFKRKGVLFDTGMHYIGSYDDGQILNTFFKYLGIHDKIDVSPLSKDSFDILSVGGKTYHIPQGVENFKAYLNEQFPEEGAAINSYFDKLQEIYDSVDLLNLREISLEIMPVKKGIDESVYDFVCNLTDNNDLRNILCMLNSLYAGKKESSSLFAHTIINLFYLQSAWKLNKGGGQIASALKQVIEENGGTVRTRSKVVSMQCKDGLLEQIQLENGETVKADKYISNIDPLTSMQMLEGANIRKAFTRRLEKLEHSISCFSLYIVLKEKSFKYLNANYYYYSKNDVWGIDTYSEEEWPQGFMMYSNQSPKDPDYADGIILLCPMKYNEMKEWEDTTTGKRGESYEKMKQEKSYELIELLKNTYPDIEDSIEKMYSSTPLTYRDYTGAREGAMYGIYRDCRNPFESQILPKTRVENLYLTGQNINMHGVLGVTVGAILTCGEIEGTNNLIRDIKDKVITATRGNCNR